MRILTLGCCLLVASFIADGRRADEVQLDSVAQVTPTKRALLIGINEYLSRDVADLAGATNDVFIMKSTLEGKFGFPVENVAILTDREATRSGILGAFSRLVESVNDSDVVVIHYSGHGSQMSDVDGDELDGFDETIVPHDARVNGVNDITDDEVNDFLSKLAAKTPHVTVILDSCHSGTAARGGTSIRKAPTLIVPGVRTVSARGGGPDDAGFAAPDLDASYVVLAAARSNQLAREYKAGGMTYGIFTFHLVFELLRSDGSATYRDIMDRVRSMVTSVHSTQAPGIEGITVDKVVFGKSVVSAEPYVLVSPGTGSAVVVETGLVHGASKGSRYAVYPPGTKSFDPANSVATIELTNVEAYSSEGRLVAGALLQEFSRAVEIAHSYEDVKIAVRFADVEASNVLAAVRDTVEARSNIQAASGEDYAIRVREVDGSIRIEGADGTLLSKPVAVADANVVNSVAKKLTNWVKWHNLLSLQNAHAKTKVSLAVNVGPAAGRRDPFGSHVPTVLEAHPGDDIEVAVRNDSKHDVYVSVLVLSSDGSIDVVYPWGGASELVAPGRVVKETFAADIDADAQELTGIFKVFATTHPVDFSTLIQDAVRGEREVSDDPLLALLLQAAKGIRARTTVVDRESWFTAIRTVTVRRR